MTQRLKSLTGQDIPSYDTFDVNTARPGLYLGLFHGRSSPNQQLSDWGVGGPVIGPLKWCHTTYACEAKLGFHTAEDHDRYFPREAVGWTDSTHTQVCAWAEDAELAIEGDLIRYGD